MDAHEEVEAAWAMVDEASNEAAARWDVTLAELKALKGAGLSPQKTQEMITKITSHVGWLRALGHDAEEPIPPAPPA